MVAPFAPASKRGDPPSGSRAYPPAMTAPAATDATYARVPPSAETPGSRFPLRTTNSTITIDKRSARSPHAAASFKTRFPVAHGGSVRLGQRALRQPRGTQLRRRSSREPFNRRIRSSALTMCAVGITVTSNDEAAMKYPSRNLFSPSKEPPLRMVQC